MALKVSLCTAVLLLTSLVFADGLLDRARQDYGFDGWPGRDGALKQGVLLKKVDLSPYEVVSVRNMPASSGGVTLRYGAKDTGRPAFEVRAKVLDSALEAQEELLRFLCSCTAKVPKGDALGVAVGDVCFAAKDAGVLKAVAFSRNNVFVLVRLMPARGAGEAEVPPDAGGIAGKIDERIKQEEEAKSAQDLNRPVISEFSAAGATAKPDSPVEVTLEVSDPKGEKLDILFDEGGGMLYEHEGKRYFKAEKPGLYKISVYVINEHFLVSMKSITIRVEN